jgi:hypothetical protein
MSTGPPLVEAALGVDRAQRFPSFNLWTRPWPKLAALAIAVAI